MKKIGIIVAMESELRMLLELMEGDLRIEFEGQHFHTGCIGDLEVIAMQCGIGKVNAAVGALTMIRNFEPELIINTGIAGGTGHGADVLDIVIGRKVGYHDVWCGPGTVPGQVQGLPALFSGDIEVLGLPESDAVAPELLTISVPGYDGRVFAGLIASGDMFISTPEQLQAVLKVQPEAVAVDMESGAIAQVCFLKKVPFLAIRVVSDTPGSDNHLDQYLDFWKVAPQSTFAMLRHILSAIHA